MVNGTLCRGLFVFYVFWGIILASEQKAPLGFHTFRQRGVAQGE